MRRGRQTAAQVLGNRLGQDGRVQTERLWLGNAEGTLGYSEQTGWKERGSIPREAVALKEEGASLVSVRKPGWECRCPSHSRALPDSGIRIATPINAVPIRSQLAQDCHRLPRIREGSSFLGRQRVSVPGAAPRIVVFKRHQPPWPVGPAG